MVYAAHAFINRPVAANDVFGRWLGDYKHWREELAEIINEYQSWVEAEGLGNGDDDLRVYELIDTLKSDQLIVALVAEYSRGKTELINAIFFSDYNQRLLPSEAGRTTMCPNELKYDPHDPPCVKLLPIETRANTSTIAEYKRSNVHWTVLPLVLGDPKKMAEAFRAIAQTKLVSAREAEELGLYDPRSPLSLTPQDDGRVEIPVWRHAIVNFPHPLLKQGLVVLDTPGLNSLGTEPELTFGMLPNAHAMIFVLAADTGVTRSDYSIWRDHVCRARGSIPAGRIVALNKIDALWDELRDEPSIAATIEQQRAETARLLNVPLDTVFPVSARKGRLAKIKMDPMLAIRSGLPALERQLGHAVIDAKQVLLRDKIAGDVGVIVERTQGMIEVRRAAVVRQLTELRGLSGQSQDAIQSLMTRMREERCDYDRALASFQETRAVLSEQTRVLLDYVSVEGFDRLTQRARTAMHESWTTQGLQAAMKMLFDGALASMTKAEQQADNIRALVQAIYNKFHAEHGLARVQPPGFSLLPHRGQLEQLHDEAEAFRKSPMMMLTERHFVVKKFFITLVSRARAIYGECHAHARAWSKQIMAPVLAQTREHKHLMDQRFENLKRVHENFDNLEGRIRDLEDTRQNLENQLLIIRNMLRKLEQPLH